MKRLALIILTLATPLLAEQEPIRKVVEVKYRKGCKIMEFVLARELSVNCQDHAIVLTGPAERVAEAEAAIRKFDVTPPDERNVEILAYLVLASNDAATGSEPADLAPAIKQMRSLFSYKSYRLLDTMWVPVRAPRGFNSSGVAPAALRLQPGYVPTYTFGSNLVSVQLTEPRSVRLENLNLVLNLSEKVSVFINNSSFDVREGQKVVIGKTNPAGADTAVILVITAKVVE